LIGNNVEVAIHKLATQYHLPAHALGERRKLDEVRTRALDDGFRLALQGAGIDDEAELCIRNLFVPVRLRLGTTDEALATNWSVALAEEISRVLRHGPTTNVVVYHSPRQALVDMASGVARGDLRRAWAWRQLGLWVTSHAVSDAAAVNELVNALLRAPQMIVPALTAVAELGWLHSVSARFTAEHWDALGCAVLREVRGAGLPEVTGSQPPARAVHAAWQVLNRSQILAAVSSTAVRGMAANVRRAVAVLAIMNVDPGLLRRDTAAVVVNLIAAAISSPQPQAESEFDEASFDTSPEVKAEAAARHARSAIPASDQFVETSSQPQGTGTNSDPAFHSESARSESAETSARADKQLLKSAADQSWFKQYTDEKPGPVDRRRRAISRYAGLLYLIAIVQELELPEQITADEFLGPRPLAWVLHELALLLAPIEARDPAALAFAGLAPEAEFAWKDEADRSEAETRALSAFADQIVTRLASLFEAEEINDFSPLEFVTRRRGEIVADTGWIEVRFSLDDVSTEIRRAGLDLNPGYVPWLGLVVMFVYE
jgi:hypothetical protein